MRGSAFCLACGAATLRTAVPPPPHPIPDTRGPVGLLLKKGQLVRNWKQRHFVVDGATTCMQYFESEGGALKGGGRVVGVLDACHEDRAGAGAVFRFDMLLAPEEEVGTKPRRLECAAASSEVRFRWLAVLGERCARRRRD